MKTPPTAQALATAISTLTLIATPARADGTYNRCRAACEKLASEALQEINDLMEAKPAPSRKALGDTLIITAGPGVTYNPTAPASPVRKGASLYVAYSDGGSHGNPGPSGWGIAIQCDDRLELAEGGFLGTHTNQFAELAAALEAIKRTPLGATVHLLSDSQYTVKGLNTWRHTWTRNNWLTAAKTPVANKEIWQELAQQADLRKVQAIWVKGHSADKLNELCDQLAGEAIRAKGAVKRV